MEGIEELISSYKSKRNEIRKRLKEFETVIEKSDKEIFAELSFCLCTPQSKAKFCDIAIKSLQRTSLLYNGRAEELRRYLNVRFGMIKSKRIVKARKFFTKDGKLRIKEKIFSFSSPDKLRMWLVENVDGLGMKEASHFLRNIGLGTGFAILDRHILKNLKRFGVINKIKPLTKKRYLEIERKMKKFAESIGIPMEELDLLLWSNETGEIFK